MAYFKDEQQFINQIQTLKAQALNNQRIVTTTFLDPYRQGIVSQLLNSSDELQCASYSGFEAGEYGRMVIAPSFYELETADFQVTVLRISYPLKFGKLEHRDVLGALMSLGVKREMFGDIYEVDQDFYVAVDTKLAEYVLANLKKIKRFTVRVAIEDGLIAGAVKFKKEVFFVSSYRLDKIIATVFKINRNLAVENIMAGAVKVNYKTVEQISYLCNNNDIISFKKHGKVRLEFTERKSKSDNYVIEGYFYS